ncbi:4Fe-4S binding protein [Coprothermobacteraceae bacterium]|nr:4Fe-4S binding protein [Coprothermobacteraceae bacterium]
MLRYLRPLKAVKFLFKKPMTVRYPYEKKPIADRYRGVHQNDWNLCIGCANCQRVCPAGAIEMIEIKPFEGMKGQPKRPQINYGRCTLCAFCVDVCPSGSLKMTRQYSWLVKSDPKPLQVFFPKADTGEDATWVKEPDLDLMKPIKWVRE